ncbi:MAG TPA: hypothetical protein VG323_06945 [Thermoanaerobaculia bacterium]|nr:hypothetical protein [Thermoanaerobaculia bacterium]
MEHLNLLVGWTSMAAGAISGAAIGLFFHRPDWLGGYDSLPRRMLRLGHIAFFGLGIVNVLFALSAAAMALSPSWVRFAGVAFALAVPAMPACCFLTAWRPRFRLLFPIPVAAVLGGLGGLLGGALWR